MLKGRRVLRSTAPENSPKTPKNSLKSGFSTPWKKFFHCVENRRKVFPLCGKNGPFFPQCGKITKKFSILWKTLRAAIPRQRRNHVRIAYDMVWDAAAEAARSWFSDSRAARKSSSDIPGFRLWLGNALATYTGKTSAGLVNRFMWPN